MTLRPATTLFRPCCSGLSPALQTADVHAANTEAAIVAGTGSPRTGTAVAAGPTTLDGQTPPGIGSRLKDTEALPTLKR